MDPSYNNGNGSNAGGQTGQPGGIFSRNESGEVSGVPGAKPGVIASGPDPADMPDEKPAGLSLGSNRHLFRRPRAQAPRNFVMNVGGGAGAGMGAGRKSGGPKKGLIIGGLAVVIVMAVVLVVFLVMRGGKGGNNNGSTGDANYDNFLKYANYLLNGEENTKRLGSFDDSKDYVVAQKYTEKDNSFFNKAQELWNSFYENYINSEGYSETSEIAGDIKYQNQLMDFVMRYLTFTEWKEESLLNLYLGSGVDNGKIEVDKHYATLLDTTFDEGRDYATSSMNRAKKSLELLSLYDSVGCIVNGEIDYTCINRNNTAIAQLQAEYNLESSLVDYAIMDKTIYRLEEFCFKIDEDFRSKDES